MTEEPPLFRPLPRSKGEATADYNVKNYVRLIHHIGKLIEQSQDPERDFSGPDSDFQPHDVTYLKLLSLMAYARTFLHFGRSATRFFYLDVLSASGLSYVEGTRDPIPSSALCVPLAHVDFKTLPAGQDAEFEKVFCFDQNEEALEALTHRKTRLAECFGFSMPEYVPLAGEASDQLEQAISEIEEVATKERAEGKLGPLTLVFVDNLGMTIPMGTIAKLQARIRGDLVIHIPSGAIWRNIEAQRKNQDQRQALTAFFGGEAWTEIQSADDIPRVYHEQVQQATGADLQDSFPVRIRGGKHMFHLAIYARHTKGTKGKEGWVARIKPLLEACNKVDYAIFPTVKSMAVGGQMRLDLG